MNLREMLHAILNEKKIFAMFILYCLFRLICTSSVNNHGHLEIWKLGSQETGIIHSTKQSDGTS